MWPIQFLSPRMAARLAGFAVVVWFAGALAPRGSAVPLPPDGVANFQRLLVRDKGLGADETTAARELAERRNELREAASPTHLTSLGEVSRVLLLAEWGSTDVGSFESALPVDKVEAALRLPSDEAFQREVQKLLKMSGDNFSDAVQLIAAEIRRDVRLSLLERLEQRLRFYLRSARPVDRIAAANLITDVMSNSRRLDTSEQMGQAMGGRRGATSSSFLRQRLQALSGDLVQLTRDADPQVQVAAVRALSDLEADTMATVAALRPLLDAKTNVAVRRAAAAGFDRLADLITLQMDKLRPQPALKSLGQLFPAAAAGLGDEEATVRRACLSACQRVATAVDDLISPTPIAAGESTRDATRLPPTVSPTLAKPMIAVLQKSLPDLNRGARDPVPELRVAACHLLETLALLTPKVRRMEEAPLPPPSPEPPAPGKKSGSSGKSGGASLSANSRSRHPSAARPSQWAAARTAAATRSPVVPAATLGQPVKLADTGRDRRESSIYPAAFLARQVNQLPVPRQVEVELKGTVDAMIEGLSDRDYRVRLASADVLETFGARAAPALPALIKTLGDPNKFVRWSTARTVGRLAQQAIERKEAPAAVRGLMALLNDREDLSVRVTAAYALEQYGPAAKEAVPVLARAINRGDKEYIIAILHTIQGVGTDATPVLPNVAWLLRDRSLPTSVRVDAAQTLGRFGALAKEQLPTLRQIMDTDTDADVRNTASTAVLAIERPNDR